MKNLNHDPVISVIQLPCLPQSVPNGQTLPESNTTSMEIEDSECHSEFPTGHVAINIRHILDEEDTPLSSIATKPCAEYHCYQKNLKLLYTVALVVMFPALTQVAQLKFQKKSPFETHVLFTYMGVVAFVVAILTSVTFFAMENYLVTSAKECASRICYIYIILRCVFCISVILAPLSFVLVLLITDGYYWIGYFIICTLFVAIITYNVIDYLKLSCTKNMSNFDSVQRGETSSHSLVTINKH